MKLTFSSTQTTITVPSTRTDLTSMPVSGVSRISR